MKKIVVLRGTWEEIMPTRKYFKIFHNRSKCFIILRQCNNACGDSVDMSRRKKNKTALILRAGDVNLKRSASLPIMWSLPGKQVDYIFAAGHLMPNFIAVGNKAPKLRGDACYTAWTV